RPAWAAQPPPTVQPPVYLDSHGDGRCSCTQAAATPARERFAVPPPPFVAARMVSCCCIAPGAGRRPFSSRGGGDAAPGRLQEIPGHAAVPVLREDSLVTIVGIEFHIRAELEDRKSTRLNSSHVSISYAVYC